MLLTVISFIFVLGVLILIHELGHFLVARWVGIRVDRFSIGFPPHVFSKKVGETTYSVGVVPLGGYVKMAGEQPDEQATGAPDEFMSKSVGQRAAVIIAGPFMNYVLAIVLLIGLVFIGPGYFGFAGQTIFLGSHPVFDPERVLVGFVSPEGPAARAGLTEGDQIIAFNGEQVSNFDSLRVRINAQIKKPVTVTWLHQGDTVSETMTTLAIPVPNREGGIDSIGIIGFTQKAIGYQSYGTLESVKRAFAAAHVIVYETAKLLRQLLTGQASMKMLGGPVFIAQQSGEVARQGASSLFFFIAVLSVNLAVINVLPIPVLDGGHLVFLGIEKLRGSPLSMRARVVAQQIGLVVLLTVIVAVTYNDILRLL